MSSGAVSPTKKLAMPDLKYSLPELMINIEMAIFSVLHLWAFSWKPYAIANQRVGEVTDFYSNGKVFYEGGRWGFKALADAMNPLDLLKAIGRSARWLVVGRKHRLEDSSYQAHHETIGLQPPESGVVDTGTAYEGAVAAISAGRTGRYGEDEEGAVLLAHAQSNPELPHLSVSPDEEDSDDYIHGQPSRFYQQGASSYGTSGHHIAYPSDEAVDHSYPADGPLREQAPMPIPDPYRPPPLYPDDHHS